MCRRWIGILFPFLVFAIVIAWMSESAVGYLEDLTHKEHEFFAVKVFDGGGQREEIECWKSPYDGGFYLFLPSYAKQEDCTICLNSEDKLRIEGELFGSKDSLEGLLLNQEYEFELEQGKEELSVAGRLTIMQSSRLAAMYIDTASGTMDGIYQDKKCREAGSYCLITSDGEDCVGGALDYITGRGNSTWDWDKKPYRIKLQEEQDFLGMGAARSWELLANSFDASYMRNKITYDLAEDIGLPYSPDSEFVDLYLNGYYAGLYQLTEKIEVGKERVDIANLSEENRKWNDSVQEYPAFEEENQRGILFSRQPEDITGGYLMEWDVDGRYSSSPSGFRTDRGQTVLLKEPGEASKEEVAYIREFVQEFEDALYAEDGINPNTGKHLKEYIDLKSWAKKYLIEEVVKNFDGGISSQYFYKDSDSSGKSLLYAGPVWDYDGALGNGDWSVRKSEGMLIRYDMRIYDPEKGENIFRNRWFPELYRHDFFLEEVERQYETCVLPAIQKMVESGIDEYQKEIEAAVIMDKCRWSGAPSSPIKVFRETLEEHGEYIREFLEERAEFLSTVWIDKLDYCTICFRTEYGTRNFFFSVEREGLLERAPTYEESFSGLVFDGWYYDEACTQPFDIEAPVMEDLDVYAKWIPE